MTEVHLRFVPTDPSWQPTPDAARAAVEVLRRITQDRGERELEVCDEITLIEPSHDLELELTDDELTTLARALGHAIRQLVTDDDRPGISWDY